jgi:GAF domain-containing protein
VNRPDPELDRVQRALEELGRISFAGHSLESLIREITGVAARVVPGDPVTSITIIAEGRPRTVAASGDLAADLDEAQYRLGAGPCLTAATTGRPAEVRDTEADARWPEFSRRAADRGCRSILSVPLLARNVVPAGLNVYLRGALGSEAATRSLATRFAHHAVVPVSNMYLYASAVERAGHLETALDSRAVIDQAKGILMERFKLTPDQAFQALTRVSMETNTKVRDVAERFVRTGELRLG